MISLTFAGPAFAQDGDSTSDSTATVDGADPSTAPSDAEVPEAPSDGEGLEAPSDAEAPSDSEVPEAPSPDSLVATSALASPAIAAAARPAPPVTDSEPTTTGQNLTITITDATIDDDGTLTVNGEVALGTLGLNINVIYVVDTSGSTGSSGNDRNGDGTVDAGDDFNGDGFGGTVLDCQIAGIQAVQNTLSGSNATVGLVDFNSTGEVIDLDPVTAGVQSLVPVNADADGNGTSDLVDSASSMVSSGGTNFDNALDAASSIVSSIPPGQETFIVFLTDGFGSYTDFGAGGPIDALVANGAQVISVSVGQSASGCAPGTPLNDMAVSSGGQCLEVVDPAALANALISVTPVVLSGVTVTLNNGVPVPVAVNALGQWTATFSGVDPIATHTVTATARASDGTLASASVTLVGEAVDPAPTTTTTPTPDPEPVPDVVGVQPVSVSPPRQLESLPRTGSATGLVTTTGAAFLFLGAGLVAASRMRPGYVGRHLR